MLSQEEFEGFEEGQNFLKAYIRSDSLPEKLIDEVSHQVNVSYRKTLIKETNWNDLWESNFSPVAVDHPGGRKNWVGIRADFHYQLHKVEHEIVINPKMSFGTGHHATTTMMIEHMGDIDFRNKSVLDFGTGTGILAILAEKLGALRVIAIDNDERCIENAGENLQSNQCQKIQVFRSNRVLENAVYDIILANIDKQVILTNFALFVKHLSPRGILLLSGLLIEDEAEITAEARRFSIKEGKTTAKDQWICIRYNN